MKSLVELQQCYGREIARFLEMERIAVDLSIEEAAQLTGITEATLIAWETQKSSPIASEFYRIVTAYGAASVARALEMDSRFLIARARLMRTNLSRTAA